IRPRSGFEILQRHWQVIDVVRLDSPRCESSRSTLASGIELKQVGEGLPRDLMVSNTGFKFPERGKPPQGLRLEHERGGDIRVSSLQIHPWPDIGSQQVVIAVLPCAQCSSRCSGRAIV